MGRRAWKRPFPMPGWDGPGGREGKCWDIERLWLARMLHMSGRSPAEINRVPSVHIPDLFLFLGLPQVKGDPDEISADAFMRMIEDRLSEMEKRGAGREEPPASSVRMFCGRLALSEAEAEVLLFAVLCKIDTVFKEVAGHVAGGASRSRLSRFLSRVIGRDPARVGAAIARGAPLVKMRVIRLVGDGHGERVEFMDVMDGFENVLLQEYPDADALLDNFFRRSPEPKLSADDFPHLREKIELLARFLGSALREGSKGINVMLYGPPGTGKTELARLLSRAAGAGMYEVRVTDSDDDGISGSRRFSSFQLCQRLLERSRDAVVLFDECEDVFPCEEFGLFGIRRRSGSEKGFTNRLLEENPVPAIWISNAVGQIDPAFMRRFDVHLEVKPPPRSVRRRVIDKYVAAGAAGEAWKDRIASCEEVTPADIESASRVVRMLGRPEGASLEHTLEGVLKDRLLARGERLALPVQHIDPATYDLSYLNADCDLERLAESLGRNPRGSMLLYGPPGTGKTAFGHYLAEQFKKPLVFKRASEILSMWLGGTERNIAKMFAEARDDDAVLLLDEADSFLQDRRCAQRPWEVTQVNEMLTQMEEFSGLFVCSTNLIDNLDQASFRRFSVKVRFDYMKPEQSCKMFRNEVEVFGLATPAPEEMSRLLREISSLATLTPGDFATVRRKARMLAVKPDPRAFLEMLEFECRAKREPARKTVGF
ncbi:MAG: AAA family ATPase [Deltaproteobacteria bacterium]|nr:AAA family ATPase [Deltaproteobacteria bacterium]